MLSYVDLRLGSHNPQEVGAREKRGSGKARPKPPTAICLVSLQNTHQSGLLGEETAGKGAGAALLTPKTEPEELAVSREGVAPPIEESSSSSEEEELPSSPDPPRPTKRPRRELGSKGIKGGGGGPGGWTCGLCHSWFPERDEYVAHMKKEHGKVSGARPGEQDGLEGQHWGDLCGSGDGVLMEPGF